MSELVPIITTTLGIRPEIAGRVLAGLSSGELERVGGVIRSTVGRKEVVAWLRDIPLGQSIDATVLSRLGPLLQMNVATSVLNLSITAVGFMLILKRLKSIEDRLAKEFADINRKLDLSFYANFQAALGLANDAFGMRDDTNRRSNASLAINRFREAEQHYLGMLDNELKIGSPAVSPFLSTLFLAYASTARCHLELGETETALRHLQEGEAALSSRVKRYYDSIIGINPAIFLHPALADSISLERLTNLQRHYDGSLTESLTFEHLRKEIWEMASQKPETWLRRLPASIWDRDIDKWEKKGPLSLPRGKDEMLRQVWPRLKGAFTLVELAQESLDCIEGYEMELQYLMDHSIAYSDWQQIKLPAAGPDDPVAILLPEDSELLEN